MKTKLHYFLIAGLSAGLLLSGCNHNSEALETQSETITETEAETENDDAAVYNGIIENLIVSANENGSILLTWNETPDAVGYLVEVHNADGEVIDSITVQDAETEISVPESGSYRVFVMRLLDVDGETWTDIDSYAEISFDVTVPETDANGESAAAPSISGVHTSTPVTTGGRPSGNGQNGAQTGDTSGNTAGGTSTSPNAGSGGNTPGTGTTPAGGGNTSNGGSTSVQTPTGSTPAQHTTHTWGAWQNNSDGSQTRYCTVCGARQTQRVTGPTSGGGTGGTGDTGNNGSGAATQHQHIWTTQRQQTQAAWEEEVLREAAWDETVCVVDAWDEPIYETHTICRACGMDLTANGIIGTAVGEHSAQHMLNGESSSSYETQVQVGTVHHDAEYETVHHDAIYDYIHHPAEYETYEVCTICGVRR